MKPLTFNGERFLIFRSDDVTVALRPVEVDRVKILTVHPSGEVTERVKRMPWLNRSLSTCKEFQPA